jgi:hypothetical protein
LRPATFGVFSVAVRRQTLRVLGVAVALALAVGCSSLKVAKIGAATQRPANVAIYIDVHDKSGGAVAGLQEKNFKVFEDGKLLDSKKAKRALLEPRVFGVKYTLVLLDLSGPIVDSEDLPELATTVGAFMERLSDRQQVAVSVFDGNDEVAPFVGFGAEGEQAQAMVAELRKFRPRSRNTNWNGAVFQGLHTLEEVLKESTAPEKSAALVVFTDRGNDLAHSVGVETLRQKTKDSPVDTYVIGVGEKVNTAEVNAVGRNGVFVSTSLKAYKKGFEEVGRKLTADTDGRYVFSYCSPKRKGDHKVELEIAAPAGSGKVSYKFSAQGFKNGCSPKKRPTFSAEQAKPAAPPPKGGKEDEEEEGGEEEPAKAPKTSRSSPPPAPPPPPPPAVKPAKAERAPVEEEQAPEPAKPPPRSTGPAKQAVDTE